MPVISKIFDYFIIEYEIDPMNLFLAPNSFDDISYRTIADELGINRDVVKKTIKDFPQRLATAILYTPVGDTFDLSSTLDKKAV